MEKFVHRFIFKLGKCKTFEGKLFWYPYFKTEFYFCCFVCFNGPRGYPRIMSVPDVGFSFKPKRLALVTPLFQVLPTYVEPGKREGETNIPNS